MAVRPYIDLYIDGKKVDFTIPIEIYMTYAHNDLHNPTIVKNSFSKTLKLDGTPNNNRVFGCFGNMDRVVSFSDGSYSGAYFNPLRKTDFVLIRNGEILERGYVKLDKVVKKGKSLSYEITLYGGIGQFLYALSYRGDGERLKLSDLVYDYDVDINVNKDTVKDAWQYITGMVSGSTYQNYDFINFCPCYNGIPENFSADKVAIDVDSFQGDTALYDSFIKSKDSYGLVNGWLLGELKREYDEWQMNDLRSYLQRPVIRFKEIIKACCNPENNGGYTVDLDDEFFSEANDYYEKAWLTLPLLPEIVNEFKEGSVETTINGDTIIIPEVDEGNNIAVDVQFALNASCSTTASTLYSGMFAMYQGNINPAIQFNRARYVQLVIYDKDGNIVGGSPVKSFFSAIKRTVNFTYAPEYESTVEEITGDFIRQSDGTYMFGDKTYELKTEGVVYEKGMYAKIISKESIINITGLDTSTEQLFTSYGSFEAVSKYGILESSLKQAREKGWYVTKNILLNSEHTPCDYFLGYLKMFNLHIWSDNAEKKIYVRQRKNYFTGEMVDLNCCIDRDSEITIKPIVYDAKYYNFGVEIEGDCYLNKVYKDKFGIDYGIQKVNTNYNFDNSSKDLLEGLVFKGAVMNRGHSKYYVNPRISAPNDAYDVQPFYLDGFDTYLFDAEGNTTEGSSFTPITPTYLSNWWKEKGYDLFPKPDFRDKDGKSVDGANVLLFFNGGQLMRDDDGNVMDVKITDDIAEFAELNNGEPCWIWTNDWTVTTDTTIGGSPYYGDGYIPVFSRYITNSNGWVEKSFDFGTPKQLYVKDYKIDNSSDIYTQYWKNYINDEFDMNTREVDLKIRFKGRVNPDFLMNFIYYDGCYWKIVEIDDYNVTSQECTKVKMVKVNDMNNYLI